MKNKVKQIAIISIAVIIGLSMAGCASTGGTAGSSGGSTAKAGVISYEIEDRLLYLWSGTDFDKDGEAVGGYGTKTLQFTANGIEGSSDIAFEIKVMLDEMAKAGDAKVIARAGVVRFTGTFQGTDMSQVPQWWTYTIGDGGYALTIRDVPTRSNGNTEPELFVGDRDYP